jgi:hypothetical protein
MHQAVARIFLAHRFHESRHLRRPGPNLSPRAGRLHMKGTAAASLPSPRSCGWEGRREASRFKCDCPPRKGGGEYARHHPRLNIGAVQCWIPACAGMTVSNGAALCTQDKGGPDNLRQQRRGNRNKLRSQMTGKDQGVLSPVAGKRNAQDSPCDRRWFSKA